MIEKLNQKIKVFITDHERPYNSYHNLNELNKTFEREIALLQRIGFFKALSQTEAYKQSMFGIRMEYTDNNFVCCTFEKDDLDIFFSGELLIHPFTGYELSKEEIKEGIYFVLTIPKKTEVKLKFSK